MTNKQFIILTSAFIASILLWFSLLELFGQTAMIACTAAITLLTAILWVTEVIPIPVTSLIPFVLFPFTGVLSHKEVASALGNQVILLLMGA